MSTGALKVAPWNPVDPRGTPWNIVEPRGYMERCFRTKGVEIHRQCTAPCTREGS